LPCIHAHGLFEAAAGFVILRDESDHRLHLVGSGRSAVGSTHERGEQTFGVGLGLLAMHDQDSSVTRNRLQRQIAK